MAAPEGFATLTPVLIVNSAADTIETCKNGFGAEVCGIVKNPKTGKILHACLKIGESTLFVADAAMENGMHPTGRQEFYLYVDDVERAYEKVCGLGLEGVEGPTDMFWGDRVAEVIDSAGNTWKLAQKVRDVTPEEIEANVLKMIGG